MFLLLPPCTLRALSANSSGPVEVRSPACGKVIDEWPTLCCTVQPLPNLRFATAENRCRKSALPPTERTAVSFLFFCHLYSFYFLKFIFLRTCLFLPMIASVHEIFFADFFMSPLVITPSIFRHEGRKIERESVNFHMSTTLFSGYVNTRETKKFYIFIFLGATKRRR